MKNFMAKLRMFLVRKLLTRSVVAMNLEKAQVKVDAFIKGTSLDFSSLPSPKGGWMYATIWIHYTDGTLGKFGYDDLAMSERDHSILREMIKNHHQIQLQKVTKNG